MTAGLSRRSVASALAVCLALGASASGQEVTFVGVEGGGGTGLIGATDASCTVAGDTIVCPAGGVSVQFDIYLSDWEDGSGRELHIWQATVDAAGYDNGNGALVPRDFASFGNRQNGAYQILTLCFSGASDLVACGFAQSGPFGPGQPGVDNAECLAGGGIFCFPSQDFVLQCCDPISAVYTGNAACATPDGCPYSWGSATGPSAVFGATDTGFPLYGGSLILDIPPNAFGTYQIDFSQDPNLTFMTDQNNFDMDPITLRSAIIVIDAVCCLPGGLCEELDSAACVANDGIVVEACLGDGNGNGFDDACEADCDADGTIDLNEKDPADHDCDGDGICNGVEISNCPGQDPLCDDCNGNSIPDECDLSNGTSDDCTGNGIPDECEEDCNSNGVVDSCDLAAGTSLDCNGNGTPDECDIASGFSDDCTGNGNGIPDECEADCNNNGTADSCDIDSGTSQDCTGNGVPDECEEDCDENDFSDSCDIAAGRSEDCNGNGIPDECDISSGASQDCNGNGIPDDCDPDCDSDGVPDECELAGGAPDSNANGVPDSCDPGACCLEQNGVITACLETTQSDCEENFEGSHFQGIDTLCPTENVGTATHQGAVIVHFVGPVQECGGAGGRGTGCVPGDPIDPWKTAVDAIMCHQFGVGPASPAIPADFFGPGSDPFTGALCLEGVPLGPTPFGDFGDADTLIKRTGDPFDRCELPSAATRTVSVEVVALNLQSTAPITVTFNGGQSPESWDGTVDLSAITPPPGSITAVKTHCNGGTYSSELHVQPRFTFTKVGDPGEVRVLDTGLEGIPHNNLIQGVCIGGINNGAVCTDDADCPGGMCDSPVWTAVVADTLGLTSNICTDFHPGIEDAAPTTACDCDGNGVRDLCDIEACSGGDVACQDCDGNGTPNDCEIAGGAPDCNGNGIPDSCEIAAGATDCDSNGVPDECQADCGSNGVPDVCEPDCDGDGVPDECEINGGAPDCNGNGVPDECEQDCQPNGVPDACDISSGTSADCNANGFPDDCEVDCNANGVQDDCDIAVGSSTDNNDNGIPDECEVAAPLPAAAPHNAKKNRYISFDPNNGATPVAFEVTLPAAASNGSTCWVGEPCLLSDTNGVDPQWVAECLESAPGDGSDMVRDWSSYTDPATGDPVVHLRGCVIYPDQTYDVRAMAASAVGALTDPASFATVPAPTIGDGSWADCVGTFDNVSGTWGPPDSNTNFKDISAAVQAFQQAQTAPVTWLDVVGGSTAEANYIINFGDISAIIQGFQGNDFWGSYSSVSGIEECVIPTTPILCP